MSAAATAAELMAAERAARRDLFATHRKAYRRAERVDPKDPDDVADFAADVAREMARNARDASERALRSGVQAADRDAKAAIGGAVLGFLAVARVSGREQAAIDAFADRRAGAIRLSFANAIAEKTVIHGDVQVAVGLLKSRADTIAISETAMGITHGYALEAKAIAEGVGARPSWLVLEWVAELDRRTCSVCSGLSGSTCPVGGDFDGYMPGFVHARCRCFLVMRRA